MKVKRTNAEIFNLVDYLGKIKFEDKTPGFYIRLMNIREELLRLMNPFVKKREELFAKYGEKVEKEGQTFLNVPDEKYPEFMKELSEYESQELEIEVSNPIRPEDVKGLSLSDLTPLKDFIDFS